MHKSPFEALARVLARHRESLPAELVNDLATWLRSENLRFDEERFVKAVWGEHLALFSAYRSWAA